MKSTEASQRKIMILGGILITTFLLLLIRMWYVQIYKYSYYTARVRGHSQLTVRIPAIRGEICDRHGIALVENRASMEMDFYLPEIVRNYRATHIILPKCRYWGIDHGMRTIKEELDIVTIVNDSILPQLKKLGLSTKYNTHKLQLHFRDNSELPYVFLQDLDFENMARFSEGRLNCPGVTVRLKPVRHYIYGAFASHLLGYVGVSRKIRATDSSGFNFYQPDIVGKSQIEKAYDNFLKGTPGTRFLQRNARGVIEGESSRIEPQSGAKIYLTIDAPIQSIVEKALRVVGRGAAIVLDPNTGKILAMASVPSFDPNHFVTSMVKSDWDNLSKDPTHPLINRAINAYAPGSIFKLCTAIAGIRKGISNMTFNCTGGVQYGNRYMRCWVSSASTPLPPHGRQNLSTAIKNSCDSFFYQYGNVAGIEEIDRVGAMLGLGQKQNLPLNNVATGIIPSPAWLIQHDPREIWGPSYTANTAIGQGFVLTTPLQMAIVGASLANGGIVYEPRLLEKVVAPSGEILKMEPTKIRTDIRTDPKIPSTEFEKIRRGMWRVVHDSDGTGKKARLQGIDVAGKTSTAQFWRNGIKDYHAWFLCFAPYNKPRYVICVFVQGGHSGGSVAAPIAAKILEKIFALEKGGKMNLDFLSPAIGNFHSIKSIDFSKAFPVQYESNQDSIKKL